MLRNTANETLYLLPWIFVHDSNVYLSLAAYIMSSPMYFQVYQSVSNAFGTASCSEILSMTATVCIFRCLDSLMCSLNEVSISVFPLVVDGDFIIL